MVWQCMAQRRRDKKTKIRKSAIKKKPRRHRAKQRCDTFSHLCFGRYVTNISRNTGRIDYQLKKPPNIVNRSFFVVRRNKSTKQIQHKPTIKGF
jgi:hypothetical protein